MSPAKVVCSDLDYRSGANASPALRQSHYSRAVGHNLSNQVKIKRKECREENRPWHEIPIILSISSTIFRTIEADTIRCSSSNVRARCIRSYVHIYTCVCTVHTRSKPLCYFFLTRLQYQVQTINVKLYSFYMVFSETVDIAR